MGRTVREGKTTEYELVVVEEQDGHDFPRRVGYRRSESGLTAWIEGTVTDQMRHIDVTCGRVPCAH
jgi:hypothetical protein